MMRLQAMGRAVMLCGGGGDHGEHGRRRAGAGQDNCGAGRGHDVSRWPRPRVQGHPVCRAAGWRRPLESARAGGALDRREEGGRLRPALCTGPHLRRHGLPRRDERGLPLPQRVDAGRQGRREAAGDVLDSRRRLSGRLGVRAASGRRAARAQGRGGGVGQSSAGRVRISRPRGADEGVGPQRVWQLRPARPGRGAAMGARQHRRIRRRPRQRHDLRRVGRIVCRQRAGGVAAGQGTDPQGDRRKRSLFLARRWHAADPAIELQRRSSGRSFPRASAPPT